MSNPLEFVYALNIDLFAFKLQKGLSVKLKPFENSPQVVAKQYDPILKKLERHFDFTTNPPQLRADNLNAESIELLKKTDFKNRQLRWWESSERNPNGTKPRYKFLLYPQRINDSYALMLSLFRPQEKGRDKVSVKEFPAFFPQDFILNDDRADFLGQTLLVRTFLPETIPPTPEAMRPIADELRHQLFGDFCPQFYQQQEFLGSYIFDYGNPKKQRDRILILFYLRETTSQKLQSIYFQLPELFLAYHKIAHTYQLSRKTYATCEELIRTQIETELQTAIARDVASKSLSDRELETLKEDLKKLMAVAPKYALQLRNLEYTLNTVQIQIGNYNRLLDTLRSQTNNSLDFFANFSQKECPTLLSQIQADLNYLKPASNLLAQAIASIRGIVEIEQVQQDRLNAESEKQRDRQLELVVTLVGVGIGISGVIASSLSYYMQPPDPPPPLQLYPWTDTPHPMTLAIGISVSLGLCAALIVWGIIRGWNAIGAKFKTPGPGGDSKSPPHR
ncbi:hypothetical protein [Phormidium sp. CCY1219]|uniref:hypothetical protein n=1 Tax=Phormidium sp. CCY1219 TaxID=2886104 RepID=UPI002D1EACB7|nr:hypothetical protein [Phormidium sp. CCY1219]MEB3826057.1 hypothetical protein [Phormidium sp. CCY1219]